MSAKIILGTNMNRITSSPVLQMCEVSKRYPGMLAVDSVSVDFHAGEVHALLGENGAGKSTLMKMIAGSFDDYTGQIKVNAQRCDLHSPAIAKANGIGMIYQELSLARPLSIAENILIGRLPTKLGFIVDTEQVKKETRACLEKVGLDLDPFALVDTLSPHEAQLVEVAKVLGNHPKIIVMDEPTSSLSRSEVVRLFDIIKLLKAQGLAIIYISHHLPEIFKIADRVTVMRDGKKISTKTIDQVTPKSLVQEMVGQSIEEFYHQRHHEIGETRFVVKNLSRFGFFDDISFTAARGEVVGIAGLTGAGRSELARALCGIDPIDQGSITLDGVAYQPTSMSSAIKSGVAYLSEDRKREGLFLRLDIKQNILATLIDQHSTGIVYTPKAGQDVPNELINTLEIMPADELIDVSNLSGGNQQKVLLAKWLAIKPKVLILDEPTRGVDVGAKNIIHETIMTLAKETGATILLISSDLPELVGLSDRCIVLREGRRIGEMKKAELSEEAVLLRANGEEAA